MTEMNMTFVKIIKTPSVLSQQNWFSAKRSRSYLDSMGGAGATNIIPFCSCLGFSLQAAGKHGNTKQAEGKAFDMEMIWGKKA